MSSTTISERLIRNFSLLQRNAEILKRDFINSYYTLIQEKVKKISNDKRKPLLCNNQKAMSFFKVRTTFKEHRGLHDSDLLVHDQNALKKQASLL